ncbi:MMPL family transporter [Candidatus Bipolaricaulota bacterium]|nr:MMPL family transporter [Candidatus Bipolaricaulota bacterium]
MTRRVATWVATWIVAHPKWVLGGLVLITLFFALFALRIDFLTDWKKMLPHDDPVVAKFLETRDTFGSQSVVMVALAAPEGETLFNLSSLQKLYALTRELETLEESGYLEDVVSPATMDVVQGTDIALVVEPVLSHPPETEEDVAAFREVILAERQLVGTMVLPDGSAMIMILKVHPDIAADQDKVSELVQRVQEITARYQGPEEIYITGDAALMHFAYRYMRGDLKFLLPIVVLVVAAVLYIGFRSLRGLVLPLQVALMAVIWTVGLMSLCGVKFTIISTILPALLVAVGSAYGIHVVNAYFHRIERNGDRREVVVQVIEEMLNPVSITALTTAAGFLTLITSFLVPTREFGLFSAAGVMFAFLISLTLIPAALVLLPPSKRRWAEGGEGAFDQLARGVVRATHRRGLWVVLTALAVLGVFLAAIPSLKVESDVSKYFCASSPVIQGMNFVEERFGGSLFMSVVVDTGRRDGFRDPEVLRFAEGLEEYLEGFEAVGDISSIVELVKETNYTMHGDDEAYYAIPDSARAVAQLLLLYEMGGGEILRSMVTRDFSQAQISVRVKAVGTAEFERIIRLTQDYIAQHAPPGVAGYVTGLPAIYDRISHKIVHSQIVSLLASFLAVGTIVALLMGSLVAGFISLTPLAFSVGSSFGIMAYAGVNLDMATVMLASLVIGIGVDYGVHFITRYRRERLGEVDHERAFLAAFRTAGRGITYNAVTLTLGFLVLLLSNFGALQTFGWLIALTMVTSALGALVVVPAALGLAHSKFLSRLVWTWGRGRWLPRPAWQLSDPKEKGGGG